MDYSVTLIKNFLSLFFFTKMSTRMRASFSSVYKKEGNKRSKIKLIGTRPDDFETYL